jgi:hypothetical protein
VPLGRARWTAAPQTTRPNVRCTYHDLDASVITQGPPLRLRAPNAEYGAVAAVPTEVGRMAFNRHRGLRSREEACVRRSAPNRFRLCGAARGVRLGLTVEIDGEEERVGEDRERDGVVH